MNNLKSLELSDLLDLLIEQTSHHTHLISFGGTPEEFRISREILRELQSEIQFRQTHYISPQTDVPLQDLDAEETPH